MPVWYNCERQYKAGIVPNCCVTSDTEVSFLSKEAIDAVLAAEKKAKEAKSNATVRSREIISAAAEDAKQRFEAAREAAMSDMNEKLREIGEQSDALLLKSRAEAESEAASETRAAMEHMDDAVELIIGELLKNADK